MGYEPNNNYILENDVEEANNPSFQKEMKRAADVNNGLPDGYEIEEKPQKKSIQQEIQEAQDIFLWYIFCSLHQALCCFRSGTEDEDALQPFHIQPLHQEVQKCSLWDARS